MNIRTPENLGGYGINIIPNYPYNTGIFFAPQHIPHPITAGHPSSPASVQSRMGLPTWFWKPVDHTEVATYPTRYTFDIYRLAPIGGGYNHAPSMSSYHYHNCHIYWSLQWSHWRPLPPLQRWAARAAHCRRERKSMAQRETLESPSHPWMAGKSSI